MEKNKKFIVYTYGTIDEKAVFKCLWSTILKKDSVMTFIEQETNKLVRLDIYKTKDTFRINACYEDELRGD